jgi:hypothetical protein
MTPPKTKCTAVTAKGQPCSAWAFAFLQKHLPDPDAIDWNATLDEPAKELDWDI